MNHGAPQFRLQGMENAKCALNRCVLDLWRVWVTLEPLPQRKKRRPARPVTTNTSLPMP
ncbi:hypothetical protein R69658_07923 [Paraburkholderia aspalathi]|uniref:Uncharacterized protein n=1 Tax=Paraburkholderia aspalathi TaxID=1324617 RepID=A0ABM8T841_9BURK|nr:hypothetical protein R20943_03483 [Paraburkholderia aspalathi]CAE6867027.1 hypothetical protein R69658_07923 [Paraburkholderia aspalathi]